MNPSEHEAYDLIPQNVAGQIPTLHDAWDNKPLTVFLKWFTPDGPFTWYVTCWDKQDTVWAYVVNTAWAIQEQGVVSIQEIKSVRGALNLPVERDIIWKATPLTEVIKRLRDSPAT